MEECSLCHNQFDNLIHSDARGNKFCSDCAIRSNANLWASLNKQNGED